MAQELRPGSTVYVRGLVGASHLNNTVGRCQGWDAEKGRWHVLLGSGETKALRPENIVLVPAQAAETYNMPVPPPPSQPPPVQQPQHGWQQGGPSPCASAWWPTQGHGTQQAYQGGAPCGAAWGAPAQFVSQQSWVMGGNPVMAQASAVLQFAQQAAAQHHAGWQAQQAAHAQQSGQPLTAASVAQARSPSRRARKRDRPGGRQSREPSHERAVRQRRRSSSSSSKRSTSSSRTRYRGRVRQRPSPDLASSRQQADSARDRGDTAQAFASVALRASAPLAPVAKSSIRPRPRPASTAVADNVTATGNGSDCIPPRGPPPPRVTTSAPRPPSPRRHAQYGDDVKAASQRQGSPGWGQHETGEVPSMAASRKIKPQLDEMAEGHWPGVTPKNGATRIASPVDASRPRFMPVPRLPPPPPPPATSLLSAVDHQADKAASSCRQAASPRQSSLASEHEASKRAWEQARPVAPAPTPRPTEVRRSRGQTTTALRDEASDSEDVASPLSEIEGNARVESWDAAELNGANARGSKKKSREGLNAGPSSGAVGDARVRPSTHPRTFFEADGEIKASSAHEEYAIAGVGEAYWEGEGASKWSETICSSAAISGARCHSW